ncbi:hypothetical protein SAMN04489743_2822 [Pseudarthrobacter equi]|uniref:Uncharacterized protein n=1 Tax=Pseudarthrobacter equi TaxID=728066 RepID=A0A1H2A765_9MICC|nr:hypothetical protein [Pseudarthrobacter equi]SDT41723.1 hypothetical protein SAMN04489743_2822 [Pseudarthrobacter equi]
METKRIEKVFGGLADGATFQHDGVLAERFDARVYFGAEDTEMCGCDPDEESLSAPYKLDRELSELSGCWAYVPDAEAVL